MRRRPSTVHYVIVACLLAAFLAVVDLPLAPAAGAAETVTFADRAYTALTPARILDSRSGLGAPTGPVGPAGTIDVQVTGRGGTPQSGVDTVVLNLTGTEATRLTFVTAYPTGQPRPLASNLNLTPGRATPNLVVAKVGAGGKVSLYNEAGAVHLIADVLGWFAASPDVTGLTPSRILDTRIGNGAPATPVGPGGSIDVQVTGRGGVPATGVDAVIVNLTGTEPTAGTFVTAYPAGEARPHASNLNLVRGETAPNLAIVKVGANGRISLYNAVGAIHLIADVVGWAAVGGDYAGVSPARVLDTRVGSGAVAAGSSINVTVTGVAGVPASGVAAVVLNLTGTEPTAGTFVTAYPAGEPLPTASNLNLLPGQTAPNLVVATVGANGQISLYNKAGRTHLIADVVGWISTGISGSVEKPASTEVVDPARVTALDGSSVTVTGPAPAVGEVVFVAPDARTGDGLLGKVTSTAPADGGTTVRTAPVRLEEAFPSGEVHGSVDTRALAPGAPASVAKALGSRALRADDQGALAVAGSSALAVNCDGAPLTVDVDLNVEARFVLDVRWGAGGVDYLRMVFELGVEGSVTATVGGRASCDLELPPKIYLPPVWGFVPSLQPVLGMEFEGGLTLTTSVEGTVTVGAEYRDGGIRWIHSGGIRGTLSPPQAAAEMTMKTTFGPKASVKFADRIGASMFGGLFTETTISTSGNPWWKLDGGIEVSVALEADFWFAGFSFNLATLTFGRIQLARASGAWPGPKFTSTALPAAEVGLPYSAAVPVAGSGPVTTTLVRGALPPGVTFGGGRFTGTPTTAGLATLTVKAVDSQGRSAQADLRLSVLPPGGTGELPLPGSPAVQAFTLTGYYLPNVYGPGPRGEVLLCAWEQTPAGLQRRARFIARDGTATPAVIGMCDGRQPEPPTYQNGFGDAVWGADGWMYTLGQYAEDPMIRGYGPDGVQRWAVPTPGGARWLHLTADRTHLVVAGYFQPTLLLDPRTGATKYTSWSVGYMLGTTSNVFVSQNGAGVTLARRSDGQQVGGYSWSGGNARAADGTAVLVGRTFSHKPEVPGDTGPEACGTDVSRWDTGGPVWTVEVPPAYPSCLTQSMLATGDGGGYITQINGTGTSARITRIRPGGTIGFTRTENLTGARLPDLGVYGSHLIRSDGGGRLAYVTERDTSTRLVVLGPDGAVLLDRTFSVAGGRVSASQNFFNLVFGFGQVYLTLNYYPAGAGPLDGPSRSEVVSVPVAADGDWAWTRRYRAAMPD